MNPTERRSRNQFYLKLSEARGNPGIGGSPINFIEKIGADKIQVSFYEPNPLTSRTTYYYNCRQNILYKRQKLNRFYAVWHSVNTI